MQRHHRHGFRRRICRDVPSGCRQRLRGKQALQQVDLSFGPGEIVGLFGENGAGKTTLLNMMGLLEKPDSGTITICGQKNPGFSSHAAVELRRHHISYLFQNYGLIDTETVEGNMRTATHFKQISRKKERLLIEGALEQVSLRGYEKRKVYTLSGGEQQRVALAKVIAKSRHYQKNQLLYLLVCWNQFQY